MSNLETVVKEIKKLKQVAEMNPGTDVHKRRHNKGKISQAKEKLKEKFMEYRKSVRENAIFILAVGSDSQKFAEIAQNEYQCFAVNTEDFYTDILDKVPEKLYMNKTSSRNMFEHISARFEDRAHEMDVISYQPIVFEAKYKKVIKSKEEALRLVKRAINEKVGGEIAAIDAVEKVSREAVNRDYFGKVVPIVMYTEDEELAQSLMQDIPKVNRKVFVVSAGKKLQSDLQGKAVSAISKVSKEKVEETLIDIKKKVL